MIDDDGDHLETLRGREQVGVVEDEDKRPLPLREHPSETRKNCRRDHTIATGDTLEGPLVDRLHAMQSQHHVRDQECRIAIGGIERHPCERAFGDVLPLSQQRCLAVSCRRVDDDQRNVTRRSEPVHKPGAQHETVPANGPPQLRLDWDEPYRAEFPTLALCQPCPDRDAWIRAPVPPAWLHNVTHPFVVTPMPCAAEPPIPHAVRDVRARASCPDFLGRAAPEVKSLRVRWAADSLSPHPRPRLSEPFCSGTATPVCEQQVTDARRIRTQ